MGAKAKKIKAPKSRNLAIGKATPYYYLLPAFIVMAIMVFYPLGYGFWLSLTDMSLESFKDPNYIGLSNFSNLFKDSKFFTTFLRTIIWTAVNVTVHVSGGLFLAVLLNRKLPGRSILRIFLIIPWAIPQYISALTWRGMLNLQYGLINIILNVSGIGKELLYAGIIDKYPIPWLMDPVWTFVGSILTNIWLGVPFMMMICLGGLQSIDKSFYEAADIDGATSWQKFKAITLPLLKPVLAPAVVLGTVWTFNMLNVILIIAGSFANEKSQILVTEVYRQGFSFYRYGYASAYSVAIFAILLIFGIAFMKHTKGTEEVR